MSRVRLRSLVVFVLLVAGMQSALAISESDYEVGYRERVQPFFHTLGQAGDMIGQNGVRLRYRLFRHPDSRGMIVISPGYNEGTLKYDEVIYDLYQRGYSVSVLDHRGQAESDRLHGGDRQMATIDRFSSFVRDFKTFVDTIVPEEPGRPRFLLAHSMGGAIAALYLERYPEDFKAAVLSSPMLELDLGRPELVAALQLRALHLAGRDATYAPGKGPYDPTLDRFETNDVTRSRARFSKNRSLRIAEPQNVLGGQSVRWVRKALHMSLRARWFASQIRTPLLLFQAGEDTVVRSGGQERFCQNAMNCELIKFPGARHELFMEIDAIRDRVFEVLLDFFGP